MSPAILPLGERCAAICAVLGLAGLVWLIIQAHGQIGSLPPAAWFLVGSAAGLCLVAGLLAFAAGAWDDRLRRLLRRPSRPVSSADRWLTLIAAVVLLGGATVEASCFSALIDSRSQPAMENR